MGVYVLIGWMILNLVQLWAGLIAGPPRPTRSGEVSTCTTPLPLVT
jgi:hypothetical protein